MTDLDDLKTKWQSQSGITQDRFEKIGSKVSGSSGLLQRKIFHRDMAETAAAVLVICFFLPGVLYSTNAIERTAFGIAILGALIIPFVLWWGRRRKPIVLSASNFRDFVQIEISFLERQIFLLRNVAWWYILPCYICMEMLFVSALHSNRHATIWGTALFVTFTTAFMVYVWWINQVGRKKYLEPLLRYYVDMRAGLDRDDDSVMQLSDAPTEFLLSCNRPHISKLRRRIGITLTLVLTLFVAGFGIYCITSFDARTGKFIVGCAPVVGILVVVITGIWRRNPTLPHTSP
jgi:hypothetical protein